VRCNGDVDARTSIPPFIRYYIHFHVVESVWWKNICEWIISIRVVERAWHAGSFNLDARARARIDTHFSSKRIVSAECLRSMDRLRIQLRLQLSILCDYDPITVFASEEWRRLTARKKRRASDDYRRWIAINRAFDPIAIAISRVRESRNFKEIPSLLFPLALNSP